MQMLLDILEKDYAQSIILIVTVGVTIAIYYWQKRAERRDAARIIVMQIDSINQKSDTLIRVIEANSNSFDPRKFWQADNIINNNDWERYRHLFVNKLQYNEICALNNYYDNVISIGIQQKEIRNLTSEISKTFYVKYSEENDEQFFNAQRDVYVRVAKIYLETIQMQYEKILNSRTAIPYERLKQIAKI